MEMEMDEGGGRHAGNEYTTNSDGITNGTAD
jgi:hypothetical protein